MHADLATPTPRDCVRVSQLNTTNVSSSVSPTLRQDFLIAENGKDSYMGGVGMAGNGTLHVVWTRSSYGDYPSSNAGVSAAVRGPELDQRRGLEPPRRAAQSRHRRL